MTDATFAEQVLGSATPVLVKFEAQWCGPCKAMKPMVDEIAAEYSGRLTVATVDIEENQQTVYRLGVRAVPTVVLFKNGEVFAQKVGLPRKSDLTALIDKGRRVERFTIKCALQPEDAERKGEECALGSCRVRGCFVFYCWRRSPAACTPPNDVDLLIRNGVIYDGSGGAPVRGDVAVRDGRVVATGTLQRLHAPLAK